MVKNNLARLNRNYPLLESLRLATPNQRIFILKKADPDLIKALADICYNILKGNIDLDSDKRKRLVKYKKAIRRLADKNIKVSKKRKEIIQTGGFLPALLPAISIAASLISGLFSK